MLRGTSCGSRQGCMQNSRDGRTRSGCSLNRSLREVVTLRMLSAAVSRPPTRVRDGTKFEVRASSPLVTASEKSLRRAGGERQKSSNHLEKLVEKRGSKRGRLSR